MESIVKWYHELSEKQKDEVDRLEIMKAEKEGRPLPNGWKHNSKHLLNFCPKCYHSSISAVLIKEIGFEERTITVKCNKCGTIYNYHG